MSKGNSWKDKNRVAKASSDNKTYRAYEYFIQKGLTPAQASGIVGNLVQESGLQLDTQVEGFDKTGSYGIAQWLGNRKTNLIKFAEKAGKTHSDFSTQLDFVWHELNTTEKKAFNKLQTAKSPEEAALAISKYYERPSEKYAHNEKRINYANQFYSQFGNEAIPSSSNINPQEGVSIDYSTPMVSVPEGNSQEAFLAEYNKLLEKQKEDEIRQSQKVQEIDYKTKLQQKINERNFLASYVEGTDVEYVERTKNEEFYLQDGGKVLPVSSNGMYDFPKQEVIVPTSGNITMKGIKYPILGKSLETGETQMMFPEQDYFFEDTKSVLELPVLKDGGVDKQTYISNKIRTL
ncbi:MAG: phage tail tip lysozyme, partial [Methanobacterium sp.]